MSEERQRIPLDGASRVTIELSHPDLTVRWSPEATALEASPEALSVDRVADEIFLRGADRMSSSRVELTVPPGVTSLSAEVEQGDLSLEDPTGQVRCVVNKGAFTSRGGSGSLNAIIGTGDSRVSAFDGAISITAGSGDATLVDTRGPVKVNAGTGRLLLERVTDGPVSITAGTGDVELIDCAGLAWSVESGTGDVRLAGETEHLSVRSGSGDVTSQTWFGHHSQSVVTGTGDILFGLPRGVDARIEVASSRGQIDADVPLVAVGQRGPRGRRPRRFVGSIGSGEKRADISLRSGSGDIRVHWLDIERPARDDASTAQAPERAGVSSPGGGDDAARAVLESLAHGEITIEEAEALLERLTSHGEGQ
jgi:hypothetical protein